MVVKQYGKEIGIDPYDDFVQDRSMDSTVFRAATGYQPPSWEQLVEMMHSDFQSNRHAYTTPGL